MDSDKVVRAMARWWQVKKKLKRELKRRHTPLFLIYTETAVPLAFYYTFRMHFYHSFSWLSSQVLKLSSVAYIFIFCTLYILYSICIVGWQHVPQALRCYFKYFSIFIDGEPRGRRCDVTQSDALRSAARRRREDLKAESVSGGLYR